MDRKGEIFYVGSYKGEITRYANAKDIDVLFDCGLKLYGINYGRIKKLKNSKSLWRELLPYERLGEKNIMANGMIATIIEYVSCHDITIQFDDGAIRANIPYLYFKKGSVAHPDKTKTYQGKRFNKQRLERMGEKIFFERYNQYATIVGYRGPHDIDVELEDGSRKEHTYYASFKQKAIFFPTYWEGASFYQKNGQNLTILRYYNKHDVDAMFDDGTIVKHVDFREVKRGHVANPSNPYTRGESINEHTVLQCLKPYGFEKLRKNNTITGRKELDLYNPKHQIAIEYDGKGHDCTDDHTKNLICKNAGIRILRMREEGLPPIDDGISINFSVDKPYDKVFPPNLLKAINDVILWLNKNTDMSIPLLSQFPEEKVKRTFSTTTAFHKRIGEERTMNCGLKARIIAYRKYCDIDVRFEDGQIRNTSYGLFKRGTILPPNQSLKNIPKNRIGETNKLKCGLIAKIIEYRKSTDLDIELPDGQILKHISYQRFKRGNLRIPGISFKKKAKLYKALDKIFPPLTPSGKSLLEDLVPDRGGSHH